VVLEPGDEGPRCRLLETARAFAWSKFQRSPDHRRVALRHARHLCETFKAAEARWTSLARVGWLNRYGHLIEDVRVALDWSFGEGGEPHTGLALTVASFPLAFQLSLWTEYMQRHEQAIQRMEKLSGVDPRVELRLRTDFGSLVGQTRGPVAEMTASYDAALKTAQQAASPALPMS
jgi:predicted ATPase